MEVIAKKYNVLKKLGSGAMGDVYLVMTPKGDIVALKLLKSLDSKTNKQAIEQFENEFKVLKKLSHPNIGKIYDYGFDSELEKVFFTLPWLKGTDIYLSTKDATFSQCEEYFVQTLRALNYLHQKDLVHCDLKPGNIYVENGQAILIDFGLTGYWGENIVGTPTYLAPEVYRGKKHNVLSDLYACGVIFYNCLTRTQPFSGKTLQEVYDRHRSFTPPPISDINENVPKYFSDIVSILLNKKPEERFQSASAVIEEIDAFSHKNYPVETHQTLLSYLPTQSELIGRSEAIKVIEQSVNDYIANPLHKSNHIILVHGAPGVGKSKVVAKIKNDLQLAKISIEEFALPLTEKDIETLTNTRAVVLQNIDVYENSEKENVHLKKFLDVIEQKILSTSQNQQLYIITGKNEQCFKSFIDLFVEEDTQISSIEIGPYSKKETKEFLTQIIGQKEIPMTFVDQFHRNTEGLPSIAQDLIQSMIQEGLLFDQSGRWNEDLLANLEKTFEKLSISESLEQQFEKTYNNLSNEQAELVNWLSVCPHPLHLNHIKALMPIDTLETLVDELLQKKIIREENSEYSLYSTVFQNFVNHSLPDKDVKRRHTKLASATVNLKKRLAIYHLSFGEDRQLAMQATQKLAAICEKRGEREQAYTAYERLIDEFHHEDISIKIHWYIQASTLLIWLDRFKEAINLITNVEKEIVKKSAKIEMDLFLSIMEKKGQCFLHQEQLSQAKSYFDKGLEIAKKNPRFIVQKLRFLNNLALIEIIKTKYNEAIQIFKETRAEANTLSLEEKQKITNNDLGHVYLRQQKYETALHFLKEDIENFSSLKNREPLARALYSYGEAMQHTQKISKAIRAYQECIKICKEGHYFPLLLRSYNNLGSLYLSLEDYEQSVKIYQKGLEIALRINAITLKAALLFNQGLIYLKESNYALASRRFLIAKRVLENKKNKIAYDSLLLSKCYQVLANMAQEEKNNMKALGYQLERMKLIDHSETLQPELWSVKIDLANLYLENRLKDQFLKQISLLEEGNPDDAVQEEIKKLKEKWAHIEKFDEQESTVPIT